MDDLICIMVRAKWISGFQVIQRFMGKISLFRILDGAESLYTMEDLGLSDCHIKQIKDLLKIPAGLFVVTGPTGSGKTTTLYSVLSYLNSPEVNIMTLEEPVEYKLPMVRQSEVNEDKGVSFESGLRSILRQDPDIIFCG